MLRKISLPRNNLALSVPSVRPSVAAATELAYQFCHDRGRSEEMAQEAFLRAYRKLVLWRKDAASMSNARKPHGSVVRTAILGIGTS